MILDTALGPVNVIDAIPDGMKFYQIEATWPPAATMIRSNQIFGDTDRLQALLPKFLKVLEDNGYSLHNVQLRAVELDYVR